MKKFLALYLLSLSFIAADAPDEETKSKIERKIKAISKAACKGDTAGVFEHFAYKRTKWQFDQYDHMLRDMVEKKYSREANAADADRESKAMRKIWNEFFDGMKTDIEKSKSSSFCGVTAQSIKPIDTASAIEVKVKLNGGKSDTWYFSFALMNNQEVVVVDQTEKTKKIMQEKFPWISFSTTDYSAISNNP